MNSFDCKLEVLRRPLKVLLILSCHICYTLGSVQVTALWNLLGKWHLILSKFAFLASSLVWISSSVFYNLWVSLSLSHTRVRARTMLNKFSEVWTAFLLTQYAENKNQRVVCVKNLTQDDVLLHATRLRNSLGRKVVKLKTRHVTKHPSVQGTWTTDLKYEA